MLREGLITCGPRDIPITIIPEVVVPLVCQLGEINFYLIEINANPTALEQNSSRALTSQDLIRHMSNWGNTLAFCEYSPD